MTKFQFEIASASADGELREFARGVSMPGPIQLALGREPSYFGALKVEGIFSEVLVCRDSNIRRVVAVGNRSIKAMFVNGRSIPMGYLSGLRINSTARGNQVLVRGYEFLRQRHGDGRSPIYLTTIMEDNTFARTILGSGRCGLPQYRDFGRFCCMALALRPVGTRLKFSPVQIRRASKSDGGRIISFLHKEGRKRQFFPDYQERDFESADGLLRGLRWDDVFIALDGGEIIGTLAAWDQRGFRQWHVTRYAPWLQRLRIPINTLAKMAGMPTLPEPGPPMRFFALALACVQGNDRAVFAALLDKLIEQRQGDYLFYLAGLHERDPLLPELQARKPRNFPSRLFCVFWEDGEPVARDLDSTMIPYLELGSL